MKIAIYTSFAVNYLAKARVLVKTIKATNPKIDVIGCVNDRFPAGFDASGELFDRFFMVEDYPATPIASWIFRHNIMELSTATKGWVLNRLLDAGYDYVMYLDPDCWVLDDPAKIISLLPDQCSVGVVPHTTNEAESDEEIRIVETSSLRHGIYNLGFLIVRNDANGRRFAEWWAKRLHQYCIDDFSQGLFTDQRWFDLAVGYFDFIKVIRHHGIDVASWNIGQRTLSRHGERYQVDGDDLIFYHFSGVGPAGVHRWVRDKFAPADPIAAELEFRYESMIAECGQAELESILPHFDRYSDGSKIPSAHRIAYRKNPGAARHHPDPYTGPQVRSFLNELQEGNDVAQIPAHHISPADAELLAERLFDSQLFLQQRRGSRPRDARALWSEYKRSGWSGPERPNRFFNTSYYRLFVPARDRRRYPTPLHHYVEVGQRAGLSPNWIFDEGYYLEKHPDVSRAVASGQFSCGLEHFFKIGAAEGLDGCLFFNERRYLDLNPDVAESVRRGDTITGEAHFLRHGRVERRRHQ